MVAKTVKHFYSASVINSDLMSFTDITGEIKYSDTTRQRLVFDMEARLQENTEVTMAELKLFQTAVQDPSKPERRNHRPINNARVSIYWVEVLGNGSNRTSLIDSRYVTCPNIIKA